MDISNLNVKVTVDGVDEAIGEIERLKKAASPPTWLSTIRFAFTAAMIVSSAYFAMHNQWPDAIWFILLGLLVKEK